MVNDIPSVLTEEEWPCLVAVSLEILDSQDADRDQAKPLRIRLDVVSLENEVEGYVECLDRIIWRQDIKPSSDQNCSRARIWSAAAAALSGASTNPLSRGKNAKSDFDKESYRKAQAQIKKDVGRTPLSDQVSIAALERVLLSVAERIPEVGYCQGMNFIAAVGLDTGLEEESVCELMVSFAQTVADGYWTESLEGVCTDQLVLEHLARTDLSSLCSHLDEMAVPLAVFSGPWLLQLYTNVLPRNVLELVWDILVLCRGKWTRKAFMMSLSIAILRFMSGDMLLIDDSSTLLAFVSTSMPMAAGELYDRNLVISALAILKSGDCEPQKIYQLSTVYDMRSSSRDVNAAIFNAFRTHTLMRYLLDREEYQRSLRNQVDELTTQGLNLKEKDTAEALYPLEKDGSYDAKMSESNPEKESKEDYDQKQEIMDLEKRLIGREKLIQQLKDINDKQTSKIRALTASRNTLQEQLIRERKHYTEQTSALKAVLDAAQSMNRRVSKEPTPPKNLGFSAQALRRASTVNSTGSHMSPMHHQSAATCSNPEYAKASSPKIPVAGHSSIEEIRNENSKWSRNPFVEEASRKHGTGNDRLNTPTRSRLSESMDQPSESQARNYPFMYPQNASAPSNTRRVTSGSHQSNRQSFPYPPNRTILASSASPAPVRSAFSQQNKDAKSATDNSLQNGEQGGLKNSSFSGLAPDHPLFQLYRQRQRNRQ